MQRWPVATVAMVLAVAGSPHPVRAESVLRVAMTLADIPLTTGQSSQGGEGQRFIGVTLYVIGATKVEACAACAGSNCGASLVFTLSRLNKTASAVNVGCGQTVGDRAVDSRTACAA
jgi:hypothetical protein